MPANARWRRGGSQPVASFSLAIFTLGIALMTSWVLASDQRVSTNLNEPNEDPSIARLANGDMVYVWNITPPNEEILARRFDSQGNAIDPTPFLVNSYTTGDQETPSVDADGQGGFVVAWHSRLSPASLEGIRARRFASDGQPLGGEFVVQSQTDGYQVLPSVAVHNDGSFVIAWETTSFDGDASGIAARRFDSTGTPLGNDFLVNELTTGTQERPALAMDANGNFVVVWGRSFQNDSIYGRRYLADGTPQGGQFEVFSTATDDTFRLQLGLAMAPNGSFLVTYEDEVAASVFGRLFDSTGAPVGGEITVSTDDTSEKERTVVAAYDDGRFQVVWQSAEQDGSGSGVYAQTIDVDGSLLGSETRVHSTTASNQQNADVAIGPFGTPVFAWQSSFQGSSSLFTNCDGIGPCIVFTDGFESGETTAWSNTQPMP